MSLRVFTTLYWVTHWAKKLFTKLFNVHIVYNAYILNCKSKQDKALFRILHVQLHAAFFMTPCVQFSRGVDGNTESAKNVNSSFSFLLLNFNVNQTNRSPCLESNHHTWWFLGVPCPGPLIWHIVPPCVARFWGSHRGDTHKTLHSTHFVKLALGAYEALQWYGYLYQT